MGHVRVEITVRPRARSTKSWTGRALVDTGATDTFLPASVLRRLGIRPSARRTYELADGTEQELPIGFGVIEVFGRAAGATLVFAGENAEPVLGMAVLESAGFWAWFKKGSGTVAGTARRVLRTTVPDPFLNHAGFWVDPQRERLVHRPPLRPRAG